MNPHPPFFAVEGDEVELVEEGGDHLHSFFREPNGSGHLAEAPPTTTFSEKPQEIIEFVRHPNHEESLKTSKL